MPHCLNALVPVRWHRRGKRRGTGQNAKPEQSRSHSAINATLTEKRLTTEALVEVPSTYTAASASGTSFDDAFRKTVDDAMAKANDVLRALNVEIHDHPEIMWKEKHTHDVLTQFMDNQGGWTVTRYYLGLGTAWRAGWSSGKDGRVIGVNSEMDALPGIGHACGHNLIAMAGVAVAIAVRAAMEQHSLPGRIILLGTPAEESLEGKVVLLKMGAYDEMDVCVMSHPAAGDAKDAVIGGSLAIQAVEVEYEGRTAHTAATPWQGINALDAAVLAYNAVSVLRQQINPDHRIHGIIEGRDWVPNVIPDYAKMQWLVRAPTGDEVSALVKRLVNCLEAAALATACTPDIKAGTLVQDLRSNFTMGREFARAIEQYGYTASLTMGIAMSASTDFGNVTYALPAIHPGYFIPAPLNSGNHTIGFTNAARTQEAHDRTLVVSSALALTCLRVLTDDDFTAQIKDEFEQSRSK
ncbi:hypothetical protein BKA62DRAFT_719801 [Auriculariales sp. MPI-PUGE-AT-0066]|nr:hypothetical protein BKA62DRAFT_719801 [Auriculariales sp. MPI-PUGE-AT-0066]